MYKQSMSSENTGYLVLARKYRSQTFAELIGQEALVQTLTNAIKTGRLHHAYVLTGIRGTGKTSTARLLAKALNCENGPSVEWAEDDAQCAAIAEGNHVDVLEFDAASHRGVDDIADLFEGVAYAPVQGRYKVYIIDEVHMLSKQAFNSLLKTLEEPPAQVKFIFATTEVNKIPVTVLSRCQRFDLKRVTAETLAQHYTNILEKEGVKADPAAINQISKAADGSVRDGLSLLDQAMALSGGAEISTALVEEMLGLADRSQAYDLFDRLMTGDVESTLEKFDQIHTLGHDPQLLLTELLELNHLITRLKVVKGLRDSQQLSELERTRGVALADKLSLENLARVYQMFLTAATEAKTADRPHEAVAMALIRITNLATLPPVQQLVDQAKKAAPVAAAQVQELPAKKPDPAPEVKSAPAPIQSDPQPENPTPKFSDWGAIIRSLKEDSPSLGAALEQQARCQSMDGQNVQVSIKKGLYDGTEMVRDLRQYLGQGWQIDIVEAEGGETLSETRQRNKQEAITEAKEDPGVKQILDMFPDAEVVEVNSNQEGVE